MNQVRIVPDGDGYIATVNGTPLQIAAYVAEPGDTGRVMVSLIVAADSVQIGIPPTRHAGPQPERRNQAPMSTWGSPGQPDPRANVPGWAPPPASADAGRGRTGEHRLLGERFVQALRRLIHGGTWRLA